MGLQQLLHSLMLFFTDMVQCVIENCAATFVFCCFAVLLVKL